MPDNASVISKPYPEQYILAKDAAALLRVSSEAVSCLGRKGKLHRVAGEEGYLYLKQEVENRMKKAAGKPAKKKNSQKSKKVLAPQARDRLVGFLKGGDGVVNKVENILTSSVSPKRAVWNTRTRVHTAPAANKSKAPATDKNKLKDRLMFLVGAWLYEAVDNETFVSSAAKVLGVKI